MLTQVKYTDIREFMKPGDVIAFGGPGFASDIIKFKTRSPVSHVGIVMRQEREGEEVRNLLIESTSLNGAGGVSTSFLGDVINEYDGQVWWLPLANAMTYEQYRLFFNWLLDKVGREYDVKQAILSAIDKLEWIGLGNNEENFDKIFCSELCAGSLEAAGVIPAMNSSEVTPADLVSWNIYSPTCFQIKGEVEEINGYNSVQL